MSLQDNHADTFVLFSLAGATYGIRSAMVKQMEMVDQITPVPNAAPFVEGVVFSRGQVIPAINLRTRFGFSRAAFDVRSRLIIVVSQGRQVGLLVDEAREFVSLAGSVLQPPPETMTEGSGNYIESIAALGDRMIFILNINDLLNASHHHA